MELMECESEHFPPCPWTSEFPESEEPPSRRLLRLPVGYHASDFNAVSENLGGDGSLSRLRSELTRRDLWLMIDLVANHAGPVEGRDFSKVRPFNDGSHYHDFCPIDFDHLERMSREDIERCQLADLPDLNSENEQVQDALIEIWRRHVKDYGADGLRLDTVPYVPRWLWRKLAGDAETPTKEQVLVLGEVLLGKLTEEDEMEYLTGGHLSGLLNYPLHWAIRSVFTEEKESFPFLWQTVERLRERMGDKVRVLGNFIDNHDQPRFLSLNSNRMSLANALTFLLSHEGVPIVYYGTEQEMDSGPTDSDNRAPLWQEEGAFNSSHPLCKLIAELNGMRLNGSFAGEERLVALSEDFLVLGFSQDDNNVEGGSSLGGAVVVVSKGGQQGGVRYVQIDRVSLPSSLSDAQMLCDQLWGVGVGFEIRSKSELDSEFVEGEGCVDLEAAGATVRVPVYSGRPRVFVPVGKSMRGVQSSWRYEYA
uniref:Glycosyl hydrolase family 13 catalytic domain-containing protein n=1 Tax=Chromera velia CCMP2878 TaxID=1169474 RepID=A0A0G4I7X5_9ALVE|eukprot:Cvel_1954.t1-p1 / transcript=Cvel_1954.t1 / gene=Cvel_1954 / organism=Chromera_velia_CCMP2878 / gene_product=Alpha-amylase 2, putative / transcript_product=Alpha-amylase 2, putative / location=Cvel_scaffold74:23851-27666(+) / protein_length=478 / sequence_SO=supercontig / SO=protein_coding / is_pseudo=false